ncbi:hypothetical protein [Streptomyces mirabilis]|uniref:hypothetical protein n=1 Tax=Streptomyces mirabilis TaxID=68239 RepID=UPI0036B334BA
MLDEADHRVVDVLRLRRAPAAEAHTAGVVCATMVLAASLRVWHLDRGLYRPLARTCVVVAVMCVGVGAARPAPLVLGLALVLLLGVPWGLAVAYRLSHEEESAAEEVSAVAEHQDDKRR